MMVVIGCAQLLGVGRGFWCLCAPEAKIVMVAECEPLVCHEGEACAHEQGEQKVPRHDDRGHNDCASEEAADVPCSGDGAPPEDPCGSGDGGDHRHRAAREALKLVGSGTVFSMPPPSVNELPPSVLVAPLEPRAASVCLRSVSSCPFFDGSPPAPLLVARTMVRLV